MPLTINPGAATPGPAAGAAPAIPDYQALTLQGLELARKRRIADALSQLSSQDPGQMVSGYYVAPNKLGQISRLASALGGAYASHGLNQQELGLAGKTMQARQGIVDALSGPNPQLAINQALGSGDPGLTKIGEAAAARQLKPSERETITNVNNQLVRSVKDEQGHYQGPPQAVYNAGEQWVGAGTAPNGGLLFKEQNALKPPVAIGGKGQTINVGGEERWMQKELPKRLFDRLDASATQAQTAIQALDTAKRARQAIDTGALTGWSGPPAEFALRLGQMLGASDEKGQLAATQELRQSLAQFALDSAKLHLKGQGAVSDAERSLALKAGSANTWLTPNELQTLAGVNERLSKYLIANHKANLEAGSQNYPDLIGKNRQFWEIPEYQSEPEAGVGTTPESPVMSLDEYLQSRKAPNAGR